MDAPKNAKNTRFTSGPPEHSEHLHLLSMLTTRFLTIELGGSLFPKYIMYCITNPPPIFYSLWGVHEIVTLLDLLQCYFRHVLSELLISWRLRYIIVLLLCMYVCVRACVVLCLCHCHLRYKKCRRVSTIFVGESI